LTALMILITTGIVFLVTRVGVARPVEDLARSFREVGSGDLQALVKARRGDEFGRLALQSLPQPHPTTVVRRKTRPPTTLTPSVATLSAPRCTLGHARATGCSCLHRGARRAR